MKVPFLSVIQCTWGYDVKQTEIHTAEPPVPEPGALEVETPKRHKLPGTDQIPAEMIKSGLEQFALRFR